MFLGMGWSVSWCGLCGLGSAGMLQGRPRSSSPRVILAGSVTLGKALNLSEPCSKITVLPIS